MQGTIIFENTKIKNRSSYSQAPVSI